MIFKLDREITNVRKEHPTKSKYGLKYKMPNSFCFIAVHAHFNGKHFNAPHVPFLCVLMLTSHSVF